MRYIKYLGGLVLVLTLLNSCQKASDFNVNADWKDITIVYGLLSQKDSVHYLKITKAFLGEDNMLYAKIADSSNYPPGELSVRLDEYDESTHQTLRSIDFDTVTIHTKEPGDSIFYFPDQLVYQSTAKIKESYTYKLIIHNNRTGEEITSKTTMVYTFSIVQPDIYSRVSFYPGENSNVEWVSAKGGKRYQLMIRFHYSERPINDPLAWTKKSIDWMVFTDELSRTTDGGENMLRTISGDAFYSVLAAKIPVDPNLKRSAGRVDYIFSVASDDLNTYMEVTEPSSSIVQYRPPFTNVTNGIGLFSSRFVNELDTLRLSDVTLQELKDNPKTAPLGF